MSNYIPAPQNAQPVQGQNWELTPLSTESTRIFGTPTGHKVVVETMEGNDYSNLSVYVTNDTAYVVMGYGYFTGSNHRQDCEDYLGQHLPGPEIEFTCTHFDALSTPLKGQA